jgi:carboxypeptidase Taq
MTAYRDLERRFARISAIGDALGILGWDQQTMMPDGAAEGRGEQMAALSVIQHELLIDPAVGDGIAEAEGDKTLGTPEQANLREMRRAHLHATAVPGDLVEALAKATAACEMAWRRARADSDFPSLLPTLSEVLRLTREEAAAKADAFGLAPYDALLDQYDPGSRTERLDPVFAELAGFLPDLIDRVIAKQAGEPPVVPLEGPFPVAIQKALGETLMKRAGFDFSKGRLDVSLHPFCGGADDDVRITTRYDEADFAKALMGVLHETGHALYEQNRPRVWRRQPVGLSRGMTVHESQSLIVEMQACRSPEFLAWLAPVARDAFGGSGPAWEPDNLRRLYTRVARTFVRIDADEVTYPAHIVLRYRLERALIGGDLALADLPGAWAEGMRGLLGIVPPDDRLGCLQDIHWPGGSWGYFPCYTLGAMTAAQLFERACREVPDLRPALGQGDFGPLVGWLKAAVHQKGCRPASTDEILTAATGRALEPAVFRRHLEARYLGEG